MRARKEDDQGYGVWRRDLGYSYESGYGPCRDTRSTRACNLRIQIERHTNALRYCTNHFSFTSSSAKVHDSRSLQRVHQGH